MADPIRQLLSQTSYDTDGVTTIWNFSFSGGYLEQEHVKAYLLDKATGARTEITLTPANFIGPFQLELTPAYPVGSELTIYRESLADGLPLVNFEDKASLTEVSLDLNAKQSIFVAAEAADNLNVAIDAVDTIVDLVQNASDFADAADASADAAAASASTALGHANAAGTQASNAATSAAEALASKNATQLIEDEVDAKLADIAMGPVISVAGLGGTISDVALAAAAGAAMPVSTAQQAALDEKYPLSNASFRNLLDNPAVWVDQYSAGNVTTNGGFITDRWVLINSATNRVQASRDTSAGFVGRIAAVRLQVHTPGTPTGTDDHGFRQSLTGVRIYHLKWGTAAARPVTLSFRVKSSLPGTYVVGIRNVALTRTCLKAFTINAADTDEYKEVTFPGDTTGTWDVTTDDRACYVHLSAATGPSSQSGTADVWFNGNLVGLTGMSNLCSGSHYLSATEFQLEVGSEATPFEELLPSQWRQECRRYYRVENYAWNGQWTTSNACRIKMVLEPPMRATPSASFVGTLAAEDYGLAALTTTTQPTVSGSAVSRMDLQLTGFTGSATPRGSVLINSGIILNASL